MNSVLKFSDFIFESYSTSSPIVNTILDLLEKDIVDLLSKYEAYFLRMSETPMTDYDREMARLSIIYDMVKAIEQYTQPTDKLITINSHTSKKGNLEISAKIQRDEEVYNFVTEVIYAGGHNIQRLHYRYITKTNLPKTGNQTVTSAYAEKIKKLSKVEKLNHELLSYKKRVDRLSNEIELNKSKTEETIWKEIESEKDYYDWPTWGEIVKREADKNYDFSEDVYNTEKEKDRTRKLDFWKKKNIEWKESEIKSVSNEIKKLEKKISLLI